MNTTEIFACRSCIQRNITHQKQSANLPVEGAAATVTSLSKLFSWGWNHLCTGGYMPIFEDRIYKGRNTVVKCRWFQWQELKFSLFAGTRALAQTPRAWAAERRGVSQLTATATGMDALILHNTTSTDFCFHKMTCFRTFFLSFGFSS